MIGLQPSFFYCLLVVILYSLLLLLAPMVKDLNYLWLFHQYHFHWAIRSRNSFYINLLHNAVAYFHHYSNGLHSCQIYIIMQPLVNHQNLQQCVTDYYFLHLILYQKSCDYISSRCHSSILHYLYIWLTIFVILLINLLDEPLIYSIRLYSDLVHILLYPDHDGRLNVVHHAHLLRMHFEVVHIL